MKLIVELPDENGVCFATLDWLTHLSQAWVLCKALLALNRVVGHDENCNS